jgi:hypothetical protein
MRVIFHSTLNQPITKNLIISRISLSSVFFGEVILNFFCFNHKFILLNTYPSRIFQLLSWNYAKMKNRTEEYHCRIEKGRPTYVVCWRIANKDKKIIEVYYAGTHEKAPY